jgi:predicted transcriptional regulator
MEGHYVSHLSKIVEDAIAEVEAVASKGARAIDMRGLVVEEALSGIAEAGEITWPRLVKDKITYLNNTDPSIGLVYLEVLKEHDLVKTRLNVRRDVQVVSLTDKGLCHVKG